MLLVACLLACLLAWFLCDDAVVDVQTIKILAAIHSEYVFAEDRWYDLTQQFQSCVMMMMMMMLLLQTKTKRILLHSSDILGVLKLIFFISR